MSDSKGHFVWHEHLTKDTKAAIAFYGEVIGWKTQAFGGDNDYMMWVASQGPLGGLMKLPDEIVKMGAPPHWISHVRVEDVDATAEAVKKLGGKVMKEPVTMPTVGRFSIIADGQGAVISVYKPENPMPPHDASKHGEFCWGELMTTDPAAAIAFYSELFGWKVIQEMDMGADGTYSLFGVGEERLGGIMKKPAAMEMPSAWLYYVNVDDIDAAIARATKQGGKVLNGPMPVPTGARVAQLLDSQGAAFALHEAPKK